MLEEGPRRGRLPASLEEQPDPNLRGGGAPAGASFPAAWFMGRSSRASGVTPVQHIEQDLDDADDLGGLFPMLGEQEFPVLRDGRPVTEPVGCRHHAEAGPEVGQPLARLKSSAAALTLFNHASLGK